jgi:hypothetical protein
MGERPSYISARNWAIYRACQDGATRSELAAIHGVSRTRIGHIADIVAFRLANPQAKPPGPGPAFGPRRTPLGAVSKRAAAYRRRGGA